MATTKTVSAHGYLIAVRKHKGRSGKSIYEWRVYREWTQAPGRKAGHHQLAKCKTEQSAERIAEHYRARDAQVAS